MNSVKIGPDQVLRLVIVEIKPLFRLFFLKKINGTEIHLATADVFHFYIQYRMVLRVILSIDERLKRQEHKRGTQIALNKVYGVFTE